MFTRGSYKFKFLRAATCMPTTLMGASDGDSSGVSRVQMDAQGMLKVQHLLHISRPASSGGGGGFGGGVHNTMRQTTGGTMDSLADPSASLPYTGAASEVGGGSVVVPVTFVLFPEEAAAGADAQADDDAGGAAAGPAAPPRAAPRGSPEL